MRVEIQISHRGKFKKKKQRDCCLIPVFLSIKCLLTFLYQHVYYFVVSRVSVTATQQEQLVPHPQILGPESTRVKGL